MKNFFIFTVFCLMISISFAERISEGQVQTIAKNWLTYLGEKNYTIENIGFLPTNPANTIHYVNFAPKGYVILSSDNQSEPILAFHPESTISPDLIPPAALQLLNHYVEQIAFITENQLQYPNEAKKWEQLFRKDFSAYDVKNRDVAPMITATWDQGSPYNMYCPTMYSQHTLVGCVAVAMGQIMRYHQHPEQGIGSNSYTWNGQTVSADFASTFYDWTNMPNQVYNSSPFAQRQAVGTLLFHCGVGVNMEYGLDGSGANSEYAKYALQYYFGYSPTIELMNKDSYSIDVFTQILIDNLDALQPMYYAGHDGNMGHAFVCDGYQGTNHFHFNWGWSGSWDGYFYLHSLTPGYSNFNYGQQAIVSIKKPVVAYPPQNLSAIVLGSDVMLMWEIPEETSSMTGYHIYRNGEVIDFLNGMDALSYFDVGLEAGTHEYHVTAQYYETEYVQPESEPSNIVSVEIGTHVNEELVSTQNMTLLQNYPNPFNPTTTISYYAPDLDENTELIVYNLKGQVIRRFSIFETTEKPNSIIWDGTDDKGHSVASGIYFYKVDVPNSMIKKMMLLK